MLISILAQAEASNFAKVVKMKDVTIKLLASEFEPKFKPTCKEYKALGLCNAVHNVAGH